MQASEHAQSNSDATTSGGGTSRRTFLKTSATAAVAAAGVAATTGSGTADTDEIMELDLRDGVPPVTDAPQGEDVVIFNIHGYTGSDNSVSEAETLQQTLRDLGNTETVTAVTWDDSGWPSTAEASAREQGGVFADWMEQYLNENPGTTIRILGHSMGGIVTFEFISSTNGRFRVANADSIGSYEVSDAPCEGTEFHDAIDNVTKFTGNYFSTNDDTARLGSGPAECSSGSLPSNYADVDCSSSVSDHTSYKSSTGCVQKIIDNYQPGVDRTSDGDSTAPTAPSNLSSPSHGTDFVDLDWDASSDDGGSGLDHYNVYVDGSVDHQVAAGTTSTTVSGLNSGTSYDFYVTAVDGAGNESSKSNTITVTTDSSSGTAPTIDSLSAAEEFWGDDIEVDWSVSDDDGDLSTAESVLYDSSGNALNSASSSISGSSASGTHTLDPGSSTPDHVTFTVTDSNGNTDSATVSV